MNYKRNRTAKEKIEDCLDNKIKNIHPSIYGGLVDELLTMGEINGDQGKIRSHVTEKLGLPANGSNTAKYWVARGWSEAEAHVKSKEKNKAVRAGKPRHSPYSREFWMEKINPATGVTYTELEADFERNSRRPIRKEYWIAKGFSEEDAILKAAEAKSANNNKGAEASSELPEEMRRAVSRRCSEFWTMRGYSDEEAKDFVSIEQCTFSLDICIEKHGEVDGHRIWRDRQDKWQNALNSKTDEEIAIISKKKSAGNKHVYHGDGCNFYMIELTNGYIKYGISNRSAEDRYGSAPKGSFVVLLQKQYEENAAVEIEKKFKTRFFYNTAEKGELHREFGYTETIKDIPLEEIMCFLEQCENEIDYAKTV